MLAVAEGATVLATVRKERLRVLTSGPLAPVMVLATKTASMYHRILSPRKNISYLCVAPSKGCVLLPVLDKSCIEFLVPEAKVTANILPVMPISNPTALVRGKAAVGVPGIVENPQNL